ncbi:lipopolysaccharide transport system permease protein [Pseudomonas sp. NFPP18]|nr:lipopolysaccharide transport system permease protein [Pseudomonas sp. NFPP17]SDA89579.1 lipopolysaccharide transport system permease protein [Pseudomonas sp. NFPP15]SEL73309.1 lipopolysaccharide transport system permease protein [Pseudomonas sp. NFPP18]SFA66405.1 lipopolysaccharide transport system permease protein [Pseudomonas sp. NFPP13]SFU13314.1 lipopolysaccharide transport system permease protein [Pseudomonas sp. NFPP25]SFX98879.1 lipopolysaccharide transport system permease protein [P
MVLEAGPKERELTGSTTLQRFTFRPWRHRELLRALIEREVIGRYRGSIAGLLWSFLNPLLMLLVYTFVFSVVFKVRWGTDNDSNTQFALLVFTGMMVFNLFSECLTRAPGLILSHVNYVKKVVFPLDMLPCVMLGAVLFHTLVSFAVWLLFHLLAFGLPPPTALLFPLVLLPLVLFTLGLSWVLASLGVYLRDVSQVIGVLMSALLLMSAVFYPLSALPEAYRHWLYLNPLTLVIESSRDVLIWGVVPDLGLWLIELSVALGVAFLGWAWFEKTRPGFADVL